MADVSKLRLDNVTYDIKDDNARKYLVMVNEEPVSATKVVIETGEEDGIELAYQEDVDILEQKTDWFVTPEMFGAKGDGTTDDTTAIQEAFDTEKTVTFSRGKTYRISDKLTVSNNQEIDLNGATINLILKDDSTHPNIIIYCRDKERVKFHGGKFTTNWEQCTSYNTQVVGFYGNGSNNCEVYDMSITNLGPENGPSGSTQIAFGADELNGKDCYDNRVHDCVFDAVYDSFGVRFATDWTFVPNNEAYGNIVEKCIFKYMLKTCIEMAGYKTHDCKALNNLILDCGTEAIDIDKSAYRCEVSGNTILKCTGSSEVSAYIPYGGISVQTYNGSNATEGYYSHDNIITKNTIVETVGAGFYIHGKNTIIKENKVLSAQRGIGFNSADIGNELYSPSGIVSENILNGTLHGILINGAEELEITNNIITSDGTGIFAGRDNNTTMYKIAGNTIHYGSYGVYANTAPASLIVDNRLIHDISVQGATRGINILNVNYLRIINNTIEGETGSTITINNSATSDYTQIVNNKLPDGCTIDTIGTGTYSYLESRLNNVAVGINSNTNVTTWVDEFIAADTNVTSENSNVTLGSSAYITASGNVAKLSFVATIGTSLAIWTKIASVPKRYKPKVSRQFLIGYVLDSSSNLKKAICYIDNDGGIYVGAGPLVAGTLYLDSLYVI